MHGVYLTTDAAEGVVTAGFVVGLGWADEVAHERGITELALRSLFEPDDVPTDVEIRIDVDAVGSSMVVHGPSSGVERAFADIVGRLVGTIPIADVAGSAAVAVPDLDAEALWRRWGARSFGLQGLPRYAFAAPDRVRLRNLLDRFNSATLAPFGVDSSAARALEDLPDDARRPAPADEPVVDLPAHVAIDGSTAFSWTFLPSEKVADVILVRALGSCFAAPSPEQQAVTGLRRRLGSAGEHTVLHLVGRAAHPEEMAAASGQLRRLRDGAAEAELVAAPDALETRPRTALGEALHRAWLGASRSGSEADDPGSSSVPSASLEDTGDALRRILDRVLVMAPASDVMATLAPLLQFPVDRTRVRGQTFRAAMLTTAGAGLGGGRLVVGAEGASVIRVGRSRKTSGPATIRRADVAAVELWADGERSVLSHLGYRLLVDPLDWRRGARAAAAVDALAPDRVVQTGQRHPAVQAALPEQRFVDWVRFAPVVIPLLVVIFLLATVRMATVGNVSGAERAVGVVIVAAFAIGLAGWMIVIVRSVRRRQRRAAGSASP